MPLADHILEIKCTKNFTPLRPTLLLPSYPIPFVNVLHRNGSASANNHVLHSFEVSFSGKISFFLFACPW